MINFTQFYCRVSFDEVLDDEVIKVTSILASRNTKKIFLTCFRLLAGYGLSKVMMRILFEDEGLLVITVFVSQGGITCERKFRLAHGDFYVATSSFVGCTIILIGTNLDCDGATISSNVAC